MIDLLPAFLIAIFITVETVTFVFTLLVNTLINIEKR